MGKSRIHKETVQAIITVVAFVVMFLVWLCPPNPPDEPETVKLRVHQDLEVCRLLGGAQGGDDKLPMCILDLCTYEQ